MTSSLGGHNESQQVRQAPRVDFAEMDPAVPASSGPVVTYFIQAASGGPIKIGRTRKGLIASRLAALQTGNSLPLVVRRIEMGDWEASFHARFADARLVGEWFEPTPQLCKLARCAPGADDPDAILAAYVAGFRAATEGHVESHRQEAARLADEVARLTDRLYDGEYIDDVVREDGRRMARQYAATLGFKTAHATAHDGDRSPAAARD